MTLLPLRAAWNGAPASAGLGGDARLAIEADALVLSWDLAFPEPLRIPAAEPGYLDGLWEHDVVELFLTRDEPSAAEPSYLELEFGPGGHWLALAFRGVRRRAGELRDLAPVLSNDARSGRWRGSARIPLGALEGHVELGPGGDARFRGLAAACTATPSGARAYLCSRALPGERADFHQPAAWGEIRAGREAAPAR